MNKITKSAIAGTLVMFIAGSSVFAAATSTSTTTIKSTTANGVTTTTTTTTTKTTETTTTPVKQQPVKKPEATKPNKPADKNKDKNHTNNGHHYGNNKVVNCPHTKQCTNSKTCEQLKAKSAKLTCNGKPNCHMHAGTYYENKYHKVTEAKNNKKPETHHYEIECKLPKAEEKPMKKLPSKKVAVK